MLSALVVANLVCGVALHLQPQHAIKTVRWPTHAVAALPRGWVKAGEQLYVVEKGQPINAQVEVAAKWPDGSPKWVHAYASYRYENGEPLAYELEKATKPPDAPASPLKVQQDARQIAIDTGVITVTVGKPFGGVAIRHGRNVVVGSEGGPTLLDSRGLHWIPRYDGSAEVVVEQQGPAQVTVRASGWYQTESKRVEPFCRFVTRITVFAGSSIVKFDHATIFADDMRKHAVAELGFRFALPRVQGYASGSQKGRFDEKLRTIWFAQTSADRLLTLAETDVDRATAPKVVSDQRRTIGWFSADQGERRVVLLTKDFWQKCPKEVEIGPDRMVYYAWPKHGALVTGADKPTQPQEIYKFPCFHSGQLLDSRLPSEYFSALESQRESSECKAEYARAANLVGVAMHNEFALVVLPPATSEAADQDLTMLERLYVQHPIARASPEHVAASGALGPVAPMGREFPEQARAARDGMLGYARSIERYGDYGWAIYGNTHHEELMNPTAAGTPLGRPSLHRVWNNNHYQHVSTSWRLAALDGDPQLWEWARTCVDNYASIGEVRFDQLKGRTDGKGTKHAGPEVKFHNPGAFWHCKAFVPWGGRDYGMDAGDEDASLAGHWPDPSGLLFAWLLDGNRWAKEGYDLWRANIKFPTRGTRREINTTLVHAITAEEYEHNDETANAIKGMAASLSSVPLIEQQPGPLWEPTWLSRYHELYPDDETFKKYIVASADAVGVGTEAIWSLALSATAYRITGDDAYLRRHAGALTRATRQVFYDPDPDKRWDRYGFGPGPDRDHHFMLQWPRFVQALVDAKIDKLPEVQDDGHYFCSITRAENAVDVMARGARILVWRDKPDAFTLSLEGCPLTTGDLPTTSLEVLPPRGSSLLTSPRLFAPQRARRIVRPSSWEGMAEEYTVPASESGIHTLLVGSYQIGLYQGLGDNPECQLLQNSKRSGEPRTYAFKLTRGFLVPLARSRTTLTFTAAGPSDGGHIRLQNAQHQTVVERYLRAGAKLTVPLNDRAAGNGPWFLDAFSDHTGFFLVEVESDVEEPLLYGRRLQDIELIRSKLGRPAQAARTAENASGR